MSGCDIKLTARIPSLLAPFGRSLRKGPCACSKGKYYVSTPNMGTLADTKISEKNLTTVPKPVRNFLEVGAGDRVEWHVEDGRIIVEKHDVE